ncbi:transcriptional regulator Erg isoform X2 [Nematostella vectensis]|uniref:transcriptional regulator Erg isoform X2 n=1 Tax=Nematostella vectensis TaxID=45351 RepID=UPI0020775C2A|nr:transcriptional regulator Erg isoform X2 [Nematostella vectensis]
MYPRQEQCMPYGSQYGYYPTQSEASSGPYSADVNIPHWNSAPVQHQPQITSKMYPYQADSSQLYQASNSRLDPTIAFPVAIRPSAFEHARFIDKMQPAFTRIKKEKYLDAPYNEDTVPSDPRLWTREDVTSWLRWISEAYSLENVKLDRFEMNGKALCLMTLDMFLYRVPEGGRVLYHDFQRRLRLALGS